MYDLQLDENLDVSFSIVDVMTISNNRDLVMQSIRINFMLPDENWFKDEKYPLGSPVSNCKKANISTAKTNMLMQHIASILYDDDRIETASVNIRSIGDGLFKIRCSLKNGEEIDTEYDILQ